MEQGETWRQHARRYRAKSAAAADPLVGEQYSIMAQVCDGLAEADACPVAGDPMIAFDIFYAGSLH